MIIDYYGSTFNECRNSKSIVHVRCSLFVMMRRKVILRDRDCMCQHTKTQFTSISFKLVHREEAFRDKYRYLACDRVQVFSFHVLRETFMQR